LIVLILHIGVATAFNSWLFLSENDKEVKTIKPLQETQIIAVLPYVFQKF